MAYANQRAETVPAQRNLMVKKFTGCVRGAKVIAIAFCCIQRNAKQLMIATFIPTVLVRPVGPYAKKISTVMLMTTAQKTISVYGDVVSQFPHCPKLHAAMTTGTVMLIKPAYSGIVLVFNCMS